nr:hypothetical protein [Bacteroidota bacterium]
MKIKIIAILLIFSGFSATAQFRIEDYLSAPFQSAEIKGLAKQLEFINNESFRSPLFRDAEVRLRTDDLNLSLDDIRLRLGFLNPMEQKANRAFENTQTEYLRIKYKFESNQILANRYKQLIRHFYLSRYDEMLGEEVNQLSIAYEQMHLKKVSYKDWVETDERILKKELKRQDINTSIEMLEYLIGEILHINDTIKWDDFEFISVLKMQKVLLPDTTIMSNEVELALKSFELEQMAYNVEKAESRSNIGYIQAEYDLGGNKDFNKNLGFQLGISLPLFNPDKPKLQRKKLELLEEEYKIMEVKNETSLDEFKLNNNFRKHTWKYQQVAKRLSDLELLAKDITYDNMEEFLALIKYYGNLKILQHEIYLDCLNTYIEILALSGRLSQVPFVNYISEDLSTFSFE